MVNMVKKVNMVNKKEININGKKLNKLEETIKLLQKLNEQLFDTESEGYPVSITLRADGSGYIIQRDYPEVLFKFASLIQLEGFLKADYKNRLIAMRENGESEGYMSARNKCMEEK